MTTATAVPDLCGPSSSVSSRWLMSVRTGSSCWFELGEFRAQGLHAHARETDDQLCVVVQGLDGDNVADAKLVMADTHAGPKRHPRRLILVLVGVSLGRRLAHAISARTAAAPVSVRVGSELVVR